MTMEPQAGLLERGTEVAVSDDEGVPLHLLGVRDQNQRFLAASSMTSGYRSHCVRGICFDPQHFSEALDGQLEPLHTLQSRLNPQKTLRYYLL